MKVALKERALIKISGADAEVFFRKKGGSLGFTNNTLTKPIYAIVFGQKGVIAGASLEGAKYSRLIR